MADNNFPRNTNRISGPRPHHSTALSRWWAQRRRMERGGHTPFVQRRTRVYGDSMMQFLRDVPPHGHFTEDYRNQILEEMASNETRNTKHETPNTKHQTPNQIYIKKTEIRLTFSDTTSQNHSQQCQRRRRNAPRRSESPS